jgi:hypothetical protein
MVEEVIVRQAKRLADETGQKRVPGSLALL